MAAIPTMVIMTTPTTDDTIEWAAEEGGGEGVGALSGKTVITNFIWRAEQWLPMPHTYHFCNIPNLINRRKLIKWVLWELNWILGDQVGKNN
jgi:hypothetical protein